MKEGRMTDTLKGEQIEQAVVSDGQQAAPAPHDAGHDEGAPKRGTLAWLQAQPTVMLADGTTVPACHRIPAGAELVPPDADRRCRVLKPEGERCKGTRLQAYGLCIGHLGGGGMADHEAMSRRGAAKLTSLRMSRELLGIGPRSNADPRAFMRVRAHERAAEMARAVVDGPLDDRKLGTIERQSAVLKALDATFPLQQASLTLEISDPESMSLQDMEHAISLLG